MNSDAVVIVFPFCRSKLYTDIQTQSWYQPTPLEKEQTVEAVSPMANTLYIHVHTPHHYGREPVINYMHNAIGLMWHTCNT